MHVNPQHWHALESDEVAQQLQTNPQTGLNSPIAAKRLLHFGRNALQEKRARSPWRMLLDQFSDFMIIVLIVAAIISGLVGDLGDTISIIVILNAAIGFVQEYRAERAMAALKRMAEAGAHVLRDGQAIIVNASELVPGDVVLLEAGNVVPADVRLLESARLKIDESALTGESVAVEKQTQALETENVPLGDKICMAYKGTIVTFGRGRGLVIATGMNSELGKIATLLNEKGESRTPMQVRLTRLGQRLALAALAICALVFIVGILRGEPLLLMFMTSLSLAVAAIPSALPAVVTISLALGAHKMVRQHALIRRLPAVETLGSVSFICSDKTGTLTQNRMHVTAIFADNALCNTWQPEQAEPWPTLFHAMALCNDAHLDRHDKIHGEPTEAALLHAALAAGRNKTRLESTSPRLQELPFDSERKRMTTLHGSAEGVIAYSKGSPESLLPCCGRVLTSAGEHTIDHTALLQQAETMAANGLRVLALAYRRWPSLPASHHPAEVERELVFLGFAGLIDPPRSEVKEAVAQCKSAGITAVMITLPRVPLPANWAFLPTVTAA